MLDRVVAKQRKKHN